MGMTRKASACFFGTLNGHNVIPMLLVWNLLDEKWREGLFVVACPEWRASFPDRDWFSKRPWLWSWSQYPDQVRASILQWFARNNAWERPDGFPT